MKLDWNKAKKTLLIVSIFLNLVFLEAGVMLYPEFVRGLKAPKPIPGRHRLLLYKTTISGLDIKEGCAKLCQTDKFYYTVGSDHPNGWTEFRYYCWCEMEGRSRF